MPTRPAEEVFQELMTPEQIAESDKKTQALRIGVLLNKLRSERGLSQQALAEKLGITQQAVSKLEWGEEMQVGTLSRVLHALGAELVVRTEAESIPLHHVEM